jgi:polysaccharide export outer membrane protein
MPFNLRAVSMVSPSRQDLVRSQETMQLYLVDASGYINSCLGKLKVGGLSRSDVLQMLQQKIGVYVKTQ